MSSPMDSAASGGAGALTPVGSASAGTSGGATNLADVLERVLDKGIVVVGDIRVNLLDIELLTIKVRLLIAGVDTARRIGINWWENDPWTTGLDDREGSRSLRSRVSQLERQLESGDRPQQALEEENAALREELERIQRQPDTKSRSRRGQTKNA